MLTTKIRQKLQELSSEYYTRVQVIEVKAHQMVEYSAGGVHVKFTPHGVSHITAVERNYDWLLTEKDWKLFNGAELFCLLCATFFHDALMIPTKIGDEYDARVNHIERANEFLQKHHEFLGISIHEADAISQIIKAHGVYSLNEVDERKILGSEVLDLRKLGACLSLSDICHADFSRALIVVFKHLELDEESKFHWRRHMQISGITRNGGSILVSALYFSPQGESSVEEYTKSIESQLRIIQPYFKSILDPISNVELIAKKLESRLDQTIHFQTNTQAVLKVLIEGVYEREDVFIRELVQNSLDSCLIRSAKEKRRAQPYEPKILVTFFEEDNELKAFRIDDNGIGMDIGDIEDTVMWIGNSISSDSEISSLLEQTFGKRPIATFGIGMLSCFKVSNNILISTRKEKEAPLKFKLTSVNDSIKPEKSTDETVGTTLFLKLDEDKAWLIKASEAIDYYFRQVHALKIQVMTLEWDPEFELKPRMDLFKLAITESKQIKQSKYNLSEKDIVSHSFFGDDFSGKVWVKLNDAASLKRSGTMDILNEGIFVSEEANEEWLPSYLSFSTGYINFSSGSITLPAGRDRVIKNDLYRMKRKEIGDKTTGLIRELVNETSKGDRKAASTILCLMYSEADSEFKNRMVKYLDEYYVQLYKSEEGISLTALLDLAPQKIYIHSAKGRWVTELTKFDGKQFYHKEDELIDLQAAIMVQSGEIVISALRVDDMAVRTKDILETPLISAYFKESPIKVLSLEENNVIGDYTRSKPISSVARDYLGAKYKFIDISEIPTKKAWLSSKEVLINIANPTMRKIYFALADENISDEKLNIIRSILELLSFSFDQLFSDLAEYMEKGMSFKRRT